jgi:hypothetical protein
MTTAAWITMLLAWGVILSFAGRFFWKVARSPGRKDEGAGDRDD